MGKGTDLIRIKFTPLFLAQQEFLKIWSLLKVKLSDVLLAASAN